MKCSSELKKSGWCGSTATHERKSRVKGSKDWFPCCGVCAKMYLRRGIAVRKLTPNAGSERPLKAGKD